MMRATIALSAETLQRYHVEPYALKLVYIGARLAATLAHVNTLASFESPAALPGGEAYASAASFLEDLTLIRRSLIDNRGEVLAEQGPARTPDRAGDRVRLPSGGARHPAAQ